jgi:hypothetical protein
MAGFLASMETRLTHPVLRTKVARMYDTSLRKPASASSLSTERAWELGLWLVTFET